MQMSKLKPKRKIKLPTNLPLSTIRLSRKKRPKYRLTTSLTEQKQKTKETEITYKISRRSSEQQSIGSQN